MNNVQIIGNLTTDPKIKVSESGKAITNITVAVQRPMVKDKTDFLNVVAFGKTAELIADYFKKGHKIGISGTISTRNYEQEGRKVYVTEILANQIDFLTPKASAESAPVDKLEGWESLGKEIGDDELEF